MPTIKTTIISAIRKEDGQAVIEVEFEDLKGAWRKTYKVSNSEIKAERFKEILAQDLRKDLQIKDQLAEITPLVGKKFNIII